MTWRIAVTTGRFLPVDPAQPVLNRIDTPDDEMEARRLEEEQRQAALEQRADPDCPIHMLAVPNEGMMSGQPTNCYLLGRIGESGSLALIDAGRQGSIDVFEPAFEAAGIDPKRIDDIILTHCHPDHVGGVSDLQALTGASVHVPPLERELLEKFAPDLAVDFWLDHDEPVEAGERELRPIFTPGHAPGHIAFVEQGTKALIAGDMISGFGSVGIFPPHGSLRDYMSSLHRLLAVHDEVGCSAILPGHGPVIPEVRAKIEEYIAHRMQREREILQVLEQQGETTVEEIFPVIYPDILEHLSFAGKATITAHLEKLVEDGAVERRDDRYRVIA
ncbi:MAG: MBL fold metallo-hydrolase [Chloroflexota bacterium]